MQYTILVYETASELTARTDPKRKDAYWGAYRAYTTALREAGVMVGGAALEPPRTGRPWRAPRTRWARRCPPRSRRARAPACRTTPGRGCSPPRGGGWSTARVPRA